MEAICSGFFKLSRSQRCGGGRGSGRGSGCGSGRGSGRGSGSGHGSGRGSGRGSGAQSIKTDHDIHRNEAILR